MLYEVDIMKPDFTRIKLLTGVGPQKVAEEIIAAFPSDLKDKSVKENVREFVTNICRLKKNFSWGLGFGEVTIRPVVRRKKA